ncbi:hypothetical protein PLICRDRAFT_326459 [Plicaturopsis crispa FD-325 SS-3]|nr:hypothetical protein PLICRDRAFT_326459 [Plicaturopsis crispa FD-325 SS-3]
MHMKYSNYPAGMNATSTYTSFSDMVRDAIGAGRPDYTDPKTTITLDVSVSAGSSLSSPSSPSSPSSQNTSTAPTTPAEDDAGCVLFTEAELAELDAGVQVQASEPEIQRQLEAMLGSIELIAPADYAFVFEPTSPAFTDMPAYPTPSFPLTDPTSRIPHTWSALSTLTLPLFSPALVSRVVAHVPWEHYLYAVFSVSHRETLEWVCGNVGVLVGWFEGEGLLDGLNGGGKGKGRRLKCGCELVDWVTLAKEDLEMPQDELDALLAQNPSVNPEAKPVVDVCDERILRCDGDHGSSFTHDSSCDTHDHGEDHGEDEADVAYEDSNDDYPEDSDYSGSDSDDYEDGEESDDSDDDSDDDADEDYLYDCTLPASDVGNHYAVCLLAHVEWACHVVDTKDVMETGFAEVSPTAVVPLPRAVDGFMKFTPAENDAEAEQCGINPEEQYGISPAATLMHAPAPAPTTATFTNDPTAAYANGPAATFTNEPGVAYTNAPPASISSDPAATFNGPPATFTNEPAATFTNDPTAIFNESAAAFTNESAAAYTNDPAPSNLEPRLPAYELPPTFDDDAASPAETTNKNANTNTSDLPQAPRGTKRTASEAGKEWYFGPVTRARARALSGSYGSTSPSSGTAASSHPSSASVSASTAPPDLADPPEPSPPAKRPRFTASSTPFLPTSTPFLPTSTRPSSPASLPIFPCKWPGCTGTIVGLGKAPVMRHFRAAHWKGRAYVEQGYAVCEWGACASAGDSTTTDSTTSTVSEAPTGNGGTGGKDKGGNKGGMGGKGCGKRIQMQSMGVHVAGTHLASEHARCPFCGAAFSRRSSLQRHLDGGKRRKMSCPNTPGPA